MHRMRGVRIDAAARVARVEPGTLWMDVTYPAGEHGLTPLAGSSPDVGVAGYVLGGGISWLGRKYGLAANSVVAIELVDADGEVIRAGSDENSELFWALRGGGGHPRAAARPAPGGGRGSDDHGRGGGVEAAEAAAQARPGDGHLRDQAGDRAPGAAHGPAEPGARLRRSHAAPRPDPRGDREGRRGWWRRVPLAAALDRVPPPGRCARARRAG